MLFTIAKKELRQMLRDRWIRWSVMLLAFLFAGGLWSGWTQYRYIASLHTEANSTARQHWDHQGKKNPHGAAHFGLYVYKPVPALSYFDQGVQAYTGNSLFLEGHRMNEAVHRPHEDRHALARLPALSPAFILGVLFPIFIIIAGFSQFSGEREEGHLRLLLLQGANRIRLYLGKSLGLWMLIIILALPFFALGTAGLWTGEDGWEAWQRYGIMVLGYLLLMGCFIHLILLISATFRSSDTALAFGLGFWVLLVFVLPRAAAHFANSRHPTPTLSAYQAAIDKDLSEGVDGHDSSSEFTKKLEAETLVAYGVDDVAALPFNWSGFVMQKGEEHESYVFQKHRDSLLEIFRRQEEWRTAFSWASPVLLLDLISSQLSGTDLGAYFDFLKQAETYRVQLVGELNRDLMENFNYGDWEGVRDSTFFAGNKRFEYLPPDLARIEGPVRDRFIQLLLWCILSGLTGLGIAARIKIL